MNPPQTLYRYKGPDADFQGDIYRIAMGGKQSIFAISANAAWEGSPMEFHQQFTKLPPGTVESDKEGVEA